MSLVPAELCLRAQVHLRQGHTIHPLLKWQSPSQGLLMSLLEVLCNFHRRQRAQLHLHLVPQRHCLKQLLQLKQQHLGHLGHLQLQIVQQTPVQNRMVGGMFN